MIKDSITSRQLDARGRAFGDDQASVHRFLVGHLGPWLLVPGTNSSLAQDARLLGGAQCHLLVVAQGGGADPAWAGRSADLTVRSMARHASSLLARGAGHDAAGALELALERWRLDCGRLTDDPVGRHALGRTSVAAALVDWPTARLVSHGRCLAACTAAGSSAAGTLHSGTVELDDDSLIVVATESLTHTLADDRWLSGVSGLPDASSTAAALVEGAADRAGALAVARVRGPSGDAPGPGRPGTPDR